MLSARDSNRVKTIKPKQFFAHLVLASLVRERCGALFTERQSERAAERGASSLQTCDKGQKQARWRCSSRRRSRREGASFI